MNLVESTDYEFGREYRL